MAEHSPRYKTVSDYYKNGLWNATMVQNAVGRWITEAEAEKILSQKGE